MIWQDSLATQGYAVLPGADAVTVNALITALESAGTAGRQRHGAVYAIRNLLETVPAVAAYARSPAALELVRAILGPGCFPVRGLLFDKTPEANWKVIWHQDLSIAVRERRDVAGFRAWSVKEDVPHVQPPAAILESMLTLRLHLDPCGMNNGPLRVIPGSHRFGRLSAEGIDEMRQRFAEVEVTAKPADVLLMRPLLLHASSSASAPGHRRVIHLEFASGPLPGGLEWHIAPCA